MTASEKARMLRCASTLVIAAYAKVRLTPRNSRALPADFFTKPSSLGTLNTFSKDKNI